VSTKVSEIVAHEIVTDIIRDGARPGDGLPPESQMLAEYGVGRGSLREALRILEVYGLITIRSGPGGGPVVSELGPRDLARALSLHFSTSAITYGQLLESSRILQVALVTRAAHLRQAEQLDAMRAALAAMDTNDEHAFGRATHDFHTAAVSVPGSRLLTLFYDAVHEMILMRLKTAFSISEARKGGGDHRTILDAVEAGDAAGAAAAMDAHLLALQRLYIERFPDLMSERIDWL
jgi:GntR family transcriptional repressor for pyruvate dehydrogenase complex